MIGMYRVLDKHTNEYVDGFYVDGDGAMYCMKKRMLLPDKLVYVHEIDDTDERYALQYATGVYDRNDHMIYEGDICRLYGMSDASEPIVAIVSWDDNIGLFCTYDFNNMKFYGIPGNESSVNIEVIGNIGADDYHDISKDIGAVSETKEEDDNGESA